LPIIHLKLRELWIYSLHLNIIKIHFTFYSGSRGWTQHVWSEQYPTRRNVRHKCNFSAETSCNQLWRAEQNVRLYLFYIFLMVQNIYFCNFSTGVYWAYQKCLNIWVYISLNYGWNVCCPTPRGKYFMYILNGNKFNYIK
jgi:hypothetical protein